MAATGRQPAMRGTGGAPPLFFFLLRICNAQVFQTPWLILSIFHCVALLYLLLQAKGVYRLKHKIRWFSEMFLTSASLRWVLLEATCSIGL